MAGYKQNKNTVRRKDGTIIVGDGSTEINVEGKINAAGNLNIKYPFSDPNTTNTSVDLYPPWDIWHGGHFMEATKNSDIVWEYDFLSRAICIS